MVENNEPLLPLLFDLVKNHLQRVSKFALRIFWKDIEKYLTNARLVADLIIQERPDLKDILYSPEGRRWLIKNLQEIYDFLYDYTWGD